MKKLISCLFTGFLCLQLVPATAQSSKEDVDILQAAFGKNKKELVSAYMQVPATQSDAFWTLYDEYEGKRKAIGKERLELIADYANNYDNLTDDKADELARQTLKNDQEYTKLYQTYLKKFNKLVGGKQAAKLFQLETYLQTIVKSSIMENVPFIGELDKSKVTSQ